MWWPVLLLRCRGSPVPCWEDVVCVGLSSQYPGLVGHSQDVGVFLLFAAEIMLLTWALALAVNQDSPELFGIRASLRLQ